MLILNRRAGWVYVTAHLYHCTFLPMNLSGGKSFLRTDLGISEPLAS
jgi:hypothetical protein